MKFNTNLLLACLLLNCKSISAFVLPSSINKQSIIHHTRLNLKLESLEQKTPDDQEVDRLLDTYGEKSRFYRRNVFSAADWIRARRSNRYQKYLRSTFESGLVRQLQPEMLAILTVSALVVLYNDILAKGYIDLGGIRHEGLLPFLPPLELPMVSWSLSSGALGLLLTFRTSTSYARWNEARTAWGKVINDSRSITRMACIWSKSYKRMNNESLQRLGDAVCSFSRSLMNRTLPPQEDEAKFVMYTYKQIKDQNYAKVLRQAQHRPTAALAEITSILVDFQLNPLHQVEVENAVTGLCDALGASERIFTSPVPTFYTRHTSRFLAFWLFTLPMGLYEPLTDSWNHWAVIPMTLLIASLFLGIDELATQMEEPFSILPMEKMCDGSIRTAVMEQVERSQLGVQADYCGDESDYLIDTSPDSVRSLPHFLSDDNDDDISPQHQHHFPSNALESQTVNGGATSAEASHVNGFSISPNGESSSHTKGVHGVENTVNGLSHQPITTAEEPPKMNPAPTFEEYMKTRNLESL